MTLARTPQEPSHCSRRQFLRRSATTGAAAYGALSLARGVHAAGSDAIKIGLIGCGGRGGGAAANAMNAGKDVRLVAMADVFADHLQDSRRLLKKTYPEQVAVDDDHCFVGFDAYEKLIQSGVDVVLIACTSHFHPVMLKAAVDAGKHVFCEKPHGIDVPGVKLSMAAAEEARKKNLCLVSGLCWRVRSGRPRGHQADPGRGDRRDHRRRNDLPSRTVHPPPPRVWLERNAVPVPKLVPLQLAFWRRHLAVADPQHHDGLLVAGQRAAAEGLGHGRTPGVLRAKVRRRVRPPGHRL